MRYIHIRVAHNTISIYLIVYTYYIYIYVYMCVCVCIYVYIYNIFYLYIHIDRYIRAQNKLRSIIMSLNVLFIFVIAYRRSSRVEVGTFYCGAHRYTFN